MTARSTTSAVSRISHDTELTSRNVTFGIIINKNSIVCAMYSQQDSIHSHILVECVEVIKLWKGLDPGPALNEMSTPIIV